MIDSQEIQRLLSKPFVPQLLCGLLILMISWQWISAFQFHRQINTMMTVKPTNITIKKSQQETTINKNNLKTPLFGEFVPSDLNDAGVKQSMLNMELVGIMVSNKEANSEVIIKTAGGEEKVYKVGDSIVGHAIIKRITPQGVLLSRNGVLESLSLPKDELKFEPPAKPLIGD